MRQCLRQNQRLRSVYGTISDSVRHSVEAIHRAGVPSGEEMPLHIDGHVDGTVPHLSAEIFQAFPVRNQLRGEGVTGGMVSEAADLCPLYSREPQLIVEVVFRHVRPFPTCPSKISRKEHYGGGLPTRGGFEVLHFHMRVERGDESSNARKVERIVQASEENQRHAR
jgi:hypothetical protein